MYVNMQEVDSKFNHAENGKRFPCTWYGLYTTHTHTHTEGYNASTFMSPICLQVVTLPPRHRHEFQIGCRAELLALPLVSVGLPSRHKCSKGILVGKVFFL